MNQRHPLYIATNVVSAFGIPMLRRPKGRGNHRCRCGRTYYEKKNLVRHQRLKGRYSNEQDLLIKYKLADLSRHQMRSSWWCEQCGKCYKNKSTLYRHKKHECNQSPYQCFYCSTHYRQKYDLKMHVYRKHPEYAEEFDNVYKDLHIFKTPAAIL
ncbi:zinc finger protein 33A-like [Cylas formicarius]|uniref:zinc finger protein 33A-like n=1 Tax=Cylas formicarius TaxID=197179 RepID=UPI002958D6B6|nr:zinc finger protein 33A-like [Cylas formicarius]